VIVSVALAAVSEMASDSFSHFKRSPCEIPSRAAKASCFKLGIQLFVQKRFLEIWP